MQYDVNILMKGLPGLLLLAFAITGIGLIISHVKISREKRLNKELLACIKCKDAVLEEFKKIRHEYNNMLQTMTCFIEEEDLHGLVEYKNKLLEKTRLLNQNNLAQLVKIKDKSILETTHMLLKKAEEDGITFNLTIYNDIPEISLHKTQVLGVMQDYLRHAYESAIKIAAVIHLKISANDKGLSFIIENTCSSKPEIPMLHHPKSKRAFQKGKGIFFNRFLQNDHLVQEILIPFNV